MLKLTNLKSLFFILFVLQIGCLVHAQQDFNNFKILQSQGKIPDDFILKSSMKVEADMKADRENLNSREKRIFLEGIHYGIDELLQSGLVIYGDEISNYVTKVAKKLLEKDKDLFNKLRFYTIKSNVSNALSTDQGIVFVTTGLISQLTSEAQLAFILAHEISHYTEKHVVETFEYRTRNRGLNDQIKQLSVYSREKEFEADVLGVELFNKAGYSKKYITSTFDVLMYSYLPIDEIELTTDYFNSDLCFIPEKKFPNKKYPIKAEEDYDDTKSSHPNIQKRKQKTLETAAKMANWGEVDNYFGLSEFTYIRNLSRFERLRSDIIENQYANALYTIYILEKSFPNSLYLSRMKSQSWLGLATFKIGNSINHTVDSKSNLEGEGAAMHYFIKSLSEQELTVMAMRTIEDCRKKYKDDKEIQAIWQRMTLNLYNSRLKVNELSKSTFNEAVEEFNKKDSLSNESKSDTVEVKKLSKYEKIHQKKNGITENGIDTSNYYNFNLSDLVENEAFTARLIELKGLDDEKKEQEEAERKLNSNEKRKLKAEKNKTDISDFILVDPAAISYKKNKVDYAVSEELTDKFNESFEIISERLNLKMHTVGKGNLADLGTNGFNEKSLFTTLLIQISNNDKLDIFPVDFSYLEQVRQHYGTDKLVFSIIEHTYKVNFNPTAVALIIFPPAFLGYLPIPFILGNQTEINLIVLDISNSKITSGASYFFKEPVSKKGIQARIYDIFSNINTKK